MITFDKIVQKVLKKWWKVIFNYDIFELVNPEQKPEYITIVNKIIYKLKAQKIIIPIRNWVYIVPEKWDMDLNEIDLIEKYFYRLLKKYITYNCRSEYYISWNKALEIHLKNFWIPEKITVVNRNISKKVMIWNYEVIFKKISGSTKTKKENLYSRFSKMTTTVTIDDIWFKISNLELALLESCTIWDNEIWVDILLVNKALKKYSKFFNIDNFYYISEYKYNLAVNRLKELSKNIDIKLYNIFLDIIKKNGGVFVWEWLRKI